MKWEVIKITVARGVFNQCLQCLGDMPSLMLLDLVASDFAAARGRHSHEIATAYAEKAFERVMDWDVRCVGRLREIFPQHFPESLRTGRLACYMADNANCDWMVEKEAA
jgi:hypothetical protein